ncbi:lipopolysaccharide biosynthesis protein [Levilinea saccharolytica]|nr:hypothetical protein [Levilinea saccharolytica]
MFTSKFLANTAVLVSGTAVAQIIGVLVTPIVSRLYTPEMLGLTTVFIGFINFSLELSSLRYQFSIVGAESREDALDLTWGGMIISIFTSLLFTAGLYALISFNILGMGVIPKWTLWITAPVIVLGSAMANLRYWLIRENVFSVVSRISVYQSISRAGMQIALGLLRLGWVGLLSSEITGRLVGLNKMVQSAGPELLRHGRERRYWDLFGTLRRYAAFPIFSMPSAILDTLGASLFLPIVLQLYGVSTAGTLSFAQRLVYLPAGLVAGSVADSFQNRVREYSTSSPAQIRPLFLKTTGMLFLLGIVPTAAFIVFGPIWFGPIFGTEWIQAGVFAAILAPWSAATLMVSPVSRLIFVLGGQPYKLVYDLLAFIFTPAVLYGCHALHVPMNTAFILLTGSQIFAYGVYYYFLLYILKQWEKRQGI